jgi:hypothetical protein
VFQDWLLFGILAISSERPVILTFECRALGEVAITTYFKRLRFDAAGMNGAQTHDLPDAKREHYHYATATDPLNSVLVS